MMENNLKTDIEYKVHLKCNTPSVKCNAFASYIVSQTKTQTYQ